MLKKINRLNKEVDFKKNLKKGKYFSSKIITLVITKNSINLSRFGIVVGLKISKKAVIRNKIRRWLSEIVRLNLNKIKTGNDIVILTRPDIVKCQNQEIKKDLISLLNKSKLISDL